MAGGFTYFVILAEMRTGSNLLQEVLDGVAGIAVHGELFNPAHIGGPKQTEAFGLTKAQRDKTPGELLSRLRDAPGLNGFRYFHDHDPRIRAEILGDPACAKIVLSRNPVDSYVSLLIARQTGRWRASDVRRTQTAKPSFDAAGFAEFLDQRAAFQAEVLSALQISGQTAFYLDYEDVRSVEVINGLLRFLGVAGDVRRIATRLIPQNPEPLRDKVRNFAELTRAVAGTDWAALGRLPNFEPRRGPGVPRAVAARGVPLLYLPVLPEEDGAVRDWLKGLGSGGLEEGFTQGSLRDWMRARPGFRSFTVVRHPLVRTYAIFRKVQEDDAFEGLRLGLEATWEVPPLRQGADVAAERAALLGFLRFLRANLQGQTPVKQHLLWASQSATLQGMAQFSLPDLIARQETLAADLGHLAQVVATGTPALLGGEGPLRARLLQIADDEVASAAHAAYGRDYQLFGYARDLPRA